MVDSRLVKQIAELSSREKERFRLFVESPYFNKHKKTTQLLFIILKKLSLKRKKLNKEAVFTQLFPGETFEDQQLHNVMSYLKRLYFRFLAIRHFEDQEFLEPILTLEAAAESKQFDILENRGKQVEKALHKYNYQNSEYYYANYRINSLLGHYKGQHERTKSTFLFQKMLDNLDRFYIVEKLNHVCHLTANMIVVNTKFDFHFLDDLLIYLKKNITDYQKDLPIMVYYTILMSLREEKNPGHYKKLKEMLVNDVERLSDKEKGDLYTFSSNYCIRQINNGDANYQRELFLLYKQGLKTDIILEKGTLSEWNYKNITSLACGLKEFDWAENFIQDYKIKLDTTRRENAYNYNMAHLHYNKKMYNEALSALLLVQFTDVTYHLNTTFLLLRTYFALNDTEAVLSLIETFRIYVIRNKKLTVYKKRGNTNFLKFARQLVLLKHHKSTYTKIEYYQKMDILNEKINNAENVVNRIWLLAECEA